MNNNAANRNVDNTNRGRCFRSIDEKDILRQTIDVKPIARYPPREKVRISAVRIMMKRKMNAIRERLSLACRASVAAKGSVMPQKKDAICGSGKNALARRKFTPPTFTTMLENSETVPEKVMPEKIGRICFCQKSIAGSSPIANGSRN